MVISADRYARMIEAGVFGEDDRVELLEGAIADMTPIGPRHQAVTDRLNELLVLAAAGRATVRTQGSLALDALSQPQPDLMLLRPSPGRYAAALPTPRDVLLVIEIADTSLSLDREYKARLYAQRGISEMWLVDLVHERVEVFRQPSPEGYQSTTAIGRDGTLAVEALVGLEVKVADVLG
jgi:Uma2 family endonuclease